jgi:cardiolipin synthase
LVVTGGALTILLALVALLTVLAVLAVLVSDDRDPSIVLAWLGVIVLVPVVGLVAYFFLGRNHRREARRRDAHRPAAQKSENERLQRLLSTQRAWVESGRLRGSSTLAGRVESVGCRDGGVLPLPAASVRLYFEGADKFQDLFTDLRGARESIHLMYLIWERDELTAEVTAILLDRLAAGVRVYLMYDWLSSLPYRKSELRDLARAGASVAPCYRRLRQVNYRNHMKMAIIDRRVVYSGGMNMGQEYVDGGPRFPAWRDTHFRLTGLVVAPYLTLFGSVWRRDGRGELPEATYPDGAMPGVPVQVVHSSVSTSVPAIRNVFMVALATARSRVWIQSPYFIPDEPLLTAMCVAASSGVDVRIMMTGLPDKKLPFHAAHAYFGTVLAAGVRVFTFDSGFLHAKTVTVDEELAVIGTCNWDVRSLILHEEVMAIFYDPALAKTCAEQYQRDLTGCTEVTMADLELVGTAANLRNHVCRLFSRLL